MSSGNFSDYTESSESFTSFEELQNICPYCSEQIASSELQYHLLACSEYREVSNRNNSVRSRLFSALRDSLTLYHPWQGDEHYDSWTSSSSSIYSSNASLRSTPEFTFSKIEPTKVSTVACPVCFEFFDSETLKPLILPKCGHTVCQKCLKHIIKASAIVKCPVCRKNNPTEIGRLPVNFALLDFSESKEEAQLCSKHKLEIVGYCLQDSEVLCGACVMEHSEHECYSLDDERVNEIAEKKKQGLIDEESQLIMLQDDWVKSQEEVDKMSRVVGQLMKSHVAQFKFTEKRVIDGVKSGKKACLVELQQICFKEEIVELEKLINSTLFTIQQEIAKVKVKKEGFEALDIYEKLARPRLLADAASSKVPTLGPLYKLVLKLQADMNYKLAIKKSHISL